MIDPSDTTPAPSHSEWSTELRSTITAAKSVLQRLRTLAAFPPVDDVESLASAWTALLADDDPARLSREIRQIGDSLMTFGSDAIADVVTVLRSALEQRLPALSPDEVHRQGLVRTEDFEGGTGAIRLPRANGTVATIAVGHVEVLPDDHPARTIVPESELCSGGCLALGLVDPHGYPRAFYGTRNAIELTRFIAARQRLEREEREERWAERSRKLAREDELRERRLKAMRARQDADAAVEFFGSQT